MTGTYNGTDRRDGTQTFGGYSEQIVCREQFVLTVPEGLPSAEAAPLLCAGITSYSPLRTWKIGPGSKVAVAGLGGLGHMGVKLAAAMGAEVTVLSRSESKRADAQKLGAHAFLNTEQVKSNKPVVLVRGADRFAADSLDFDNVNRVVQLQGRVHGLIVPAARP